MLLFFFKQKTAYEMRISDWSSDVCSSDLVGGVDIERSSSNPTLTGDFAPFNAHIKAQSYFDLAATVRIGDHYNLRVGVNNILDNDPPKIGRASCRERVCQYV